MRRTLVLNFHIKLTLIDFLLIEYRAGSLMGNNRVEELRHLTNVSANEVAKEREKIERFEQDKI